MNDAIERLKRSWGSIAESMQCYAELRYYDPVSTWECYVYAVDPSDEDTCLCIIKVHKNDHAVLDEWSLNAIRALYNEQGEGVCLDMEYRPMRACELFKRLNEGL